MVLSYHNKYVPTCNNFILNRTSNKSKSNKAIFLKAKLEFVVLKISILFTQFFFNLSFNDFFILTTKFLQKVYKIYDLLYIIHLEFDLYAYYLYLPTIK